MNTVQGKLINGMMVGGALHFDFEVREPLVEDMVEAEKQVPPTELHAFNVELLCRVVTRIGSFTGPFTPGMFKRMKRNDYNALTQAMLKADSLGEQTPAGEGGI